MKLFDDSPYVRPQPRPEVQGTDMVNPAQSKLLANRERISGTPAVRARNTEDDDEVHTAPMKDYGVPLRPEASKLNPMTDTAAWRKFGEYREMPLHGNGDIRSGTFGTMQAKVSPDRVEEIRTKPETAQDPRFPGPERPLSADVSFRVNGRQFSAPTLHNGNHRVAADADSGQLFTPVSHIPAERMPDAVAFAKDRRARHADTRNLRDMTYFDRLESNDATHRDPQLQQEAQNIRVSRMFR